MTGGCLFQTTTDIKGVGLLYSCDSFVSRSSSELEFARRGEQSPGQGSIICCKEDECNEIDLKFSPDYYLSTTVEYPVQKFSRRRGLPPVPPLLLCCS
ncbi:hypothetical protein AVEN_185382-1 [Araneus ventricosus]|uniref:Uncharacterized protein n=1 Tax=Araneus ventricosus TaxID=182803 RepID=A0A4Y2W266_ARAVE|nr:hypothetical protein AVEN_185382-1 [Araneus ventricosus]